jgi:hypothetical protein
VLHGAEGYRHRPPAAKVFPVPGGKSYLAVVVFRRSLGFDSGVCTTQTPCGLEFVAMARKKALGPLATHWLFDTRGLTRDCNMDHLTPSHPRYIGKIRYLQLSVRLGVSYPDAVFFASFVGPARFRKSRLHTSSLVEGSLSSKSQGAPMFSRISVFADVPLARCSSGSTPQCSWHPRTRNVECAASRAWRSVFHSADDDAEAEA